MQRVEVSSYVAAVHKLGDLKMALSPEFRLDGNKSLIQIPLLTSEWCSESEPLIPGLPDDVALNCLLRLPVEQHTTCRAVCRQWYRLLGSRERFFTCRKELGFRDPWLYVLAYHKFTKKIEWQVFDLKDFSWHSISPMPCKENIYHHGFGCVSIPEESTLFVCGAVISDATSPLHVVMKYEVQKNRWTVMKKMITARSFFGCEVIDGMIYVAGGNSSDLFELNSAEVMDTRKEIWRCIANMKTNMAAYDTAVLNGKLLVTEGWSWPFYEVPKGQVYDPRTDNWESMPAGLREGWTGSSVVVYGHLFVIPEHERIRLKVYEEDTDCWKAVAGPPLPEQICKPFSVNCFDCRIYVVGRDFHIAVGHILGMDAGTNSVTSSSFSVQWQVVYAPTAFSNWIPSNAQVLFA
ncbi:hypothetical protein DCAR_0208916 [Daucus carota subsp. sativus]|uniref:F-box domain-containing protein n=1 Tax=Daucus carota subsp. sativus TaxID=79200 RepID=A0AAF0WK12_DAUCS|nr:PREDICTED: F-box/kelch-repeat protein At1g30090-like [Daucus carota subsp. sativus]XP_017235143.1 PREDICTED: F-box/kelch-repeat protein At1g30090-like [Daucus carota subsp. sativus]WOG89678.1 hypothetical protein DCAR_0208916 [Daucus carota subsp. sativus]